MIHYKDKTFCGAKCTTVDCDIKMTDQVRRDADAWWGKEGAPIAMADFSNGCDEYRPIMINRGQAINDNAE